jgi:ABC-2 type transport system permease protein
VRPYLAVLGARFRTLLQYRAAAWAGFGTQTFFGLVRVMIFTAFYASATREPPFSFAQMMSYVWLGQVLFALIPLREDTELAAMIRSGDVAYELVRPVHLYGFWFARALAQRTAPLLLRATPMVVVAAGLLPAVGAGRWALHAPASVAAGALFAASLLAALLLACTFSLLMSTSMLWTVAGDGVSTLFPVIVWSLSGIVLPMPFFHEALQSVFRLLPFRGLMDVPFRIYIGSIRGWSAVAEIGLQLAWAAALVWLGTALVGRGLRRLVVQGG